MTLIKTGLSLLQPKLLAHNEWDTACLEGILQEDEEICKLGTAAPL
jgi:hypothetical protein